MSARRRVGAIDVGTNTVLCLVAERGDADSIARVADWATITRLGRGVDARGALDDEAIERTLAAVREHAEQARRLGATEVRGVGTSALRDARDRDRFVARAREILDGFEVISGDDEARLTFAGAAAGLTLPAGERAVLDLGGGSTEIAIGDAFPHTRASLQLGSVRLFERWLRSDPPTDVERDALIDEIERSLDAHRVMALPPIVALAGTATTVACVARNVAFEEVERVHGAVLDHSELEAVAERLGRASLAERSAHPSIEPGRADVVVAGAILLARVARRSISPAVVISDGGLRWGLADRMLPSR
ncbi:MAG: Ppx/GppA phosphatase family protein [Sandaracinaceae bacterium]